MKQFRRTVGCDESSNRAEFSMDEKFASVHPNLYCGHFFVRFDGHGLYTAFKEGVDTEFVGSYIPYATEYNGDWRR